MDSKRKETFSRSILSSAVLAAITSFSSTTQASPCPSVDADNNILVVSGESCSGGINPSESVNDITIEGFVEGLIENDNGMVDFLINGGTLDGSFVNRDNAGEVRITNGAEVFEDILNYGQVGNIIINDEPGVDTVIHGSVINALNSGEIFVSEDNTRIEGDVEILDGAT